MRGLLDRLTRGPLLLLDGGLGTMLIARGLARGAAPEVWNLERPELVTAVHRAYVEAGSEVVHTNSFGGHPQRLAHFGLAHRCEELNLAAVRVARASGASFLVGDMGPTGEYLPPVGRAEPGLWRAGFERQARVLAEAGVDALHLETMSDLREATLALEVIRAVAPGLPVMASLSFERKRRGFFSIMGDSLAGALRGLAECGAAAVGANCSITSADMAALAQQAREVTTVPLVIQPNAGQPEIAADGVRYAQLPEQFARDLAPLATLGVAALGGCCGTDPRFIAALAAELRHSA